MSTLTNSLCISFYLPLLIANIVLFAAVIANKNRQLLTWLHIVFCGCVIFWLALEISCYVIEDSSVIAYIADLRLIPVSVIAVTQYILVLVFCRLNRYLPKWALVCAYIIPAITAVLALTTPWHGLLMREFEVLAFEPVLLVHIVRGPWFYVHSVYSQIFGFGVAYTLISRRKTLPKAYRNGMGVLIVGTFLALACIVVQTTGINKTMIDFNLIGVSAASILFYIAFVTNGQLSYLQIERKEVFDYLNEAVFIVSHDGTMIDANKPAVKWLSMLNSQYEGMSIDQLLEKLKKENQISVRENIETGNMEVYLIGTPFPLIYSLQKLPMKDRNGSMIILNDVTRNKLLIERLRDTAGVDALTGLANRHRYQELLRSLDVPENYPLSIIVGDVNSLKKVNDTFGHEEGNKMIINTANILNTVCPLNGYVARIGGDEFSLLLPKCDERKAEFIIQAIHEYFEQAGTQELQAHPTIALGCATKKSISENMNTLISEADICMYGDKARRSRDENGIICD